MKKTLNLMLTSMLLIAALAFCVSAAPSVVANIDTAEENYAPVENDDVAELLSISGSGTATDPFIVVTEEDLMLVSDFPDCHFKLANDIALTSTDWEPLCVLGDPFSGTFDGDGYTISNLTITTNRLSKQNGLFSSNIGTIKNLGVETSTKGITGYAKYVGIIAGYNSGLIQNCFSEGNISCIFNDNYETNFGGVIGYNSSSGILSKCYSSSSIELDKNSSTTIVYPESILYRNVGGLIGANDGLIEICYFNGIINLGGVSKSVTSGNGLYGGHKYHGPGYYFAGAIAAKNGGSINNCSSITTINDIDGFASTGSCGLVYSNVGSIINCYAVVSGEDVSYGIASSGTVTNSFYDKTVSGKTDTGFGAPKTTAAMKMSQTYTGAGWDFENTWAISDDINDGYPYLQWMYETTYKVTYNANGGEGAPDSQRKYEDADLVLSDVVPTREGYKFLGWATEADSNAVEYIAGATYSENAELTLYAVWEKVYAITYDYTAISTQYKEADVEVSISGVIPSMELREFLGWATSPDSDVVEYNPGDKYSENADLNLYAVWKNLYVDINIGAKTSSTNVRYYEVNGNQYALTETSDNLFRVVPTADMLIEIVEKESADSIYTVSTEYYFVDYETLTYSKLGLDSFINNDGNPSIRVSEPKGMRFKSTFSTLAKNEETEFVIEEYGFIVARQSHLDNADAQLNFDFSKYIKGIAYNKNSGIDKIFDNSDDEYVVFSGVLYNIPDTAYEAVLTSKTYTKINVNGEIFTVYGEASSASMYEIAKSLVNSGDLSDEIKAELQKIIEKVEGVPPVDDELDNEIEIEGDDLFD